MRRRGVDKQLVNEAQATRRSLSPEHQFLGSVAQRLLILFEQFKPIYWEAPPPEPEVVPGRSLRQNRHRGEMGEVSPVQEEKEEEEEAVEEQMEEEEEEPEKDVPSVEEISQLEEESASEEVEKEEESYKLPEKKKTMRRWRKKNKGPGNVKNMSSFICYYQQRVRQIKDNCESLPGNLAKHVSAEWKMMPNSEKDVYAEMLKKIHEGEGQLPQGLEEEELISLSKEKGRRPRQRSNGSDLRSHSQEERPSSRGREAPPLVRQEDMPGFKVFRKEMCSKKNGGQQPQRRVERDRLRRKMMEKWVTLSPTKQARYVKLAKQKRRRRNNKPKLEAESKSRPKKKSPMSDEEAEYEPPTRIKKQTVSYAVKHKEQVNVTDDQEWRQASPPVEVNDPPQEVWPIFKMAQQPQQPPALSQPLPSIPPPPSLQVPNFFAVPLQIEVPPPFPEIQPPVDRQIIECVEGKPAPEGLQMISEQDEMEQSSCAPKIKREFIDCQVISLNSNDDEEQHESLKEEEEKALQMALRESVFNFGSEPTLQLDTAFMLYYREQIDKEKRAKIEGMGMVKSALEGWEELSAEEKRYYEQKERELKENIRKENEGRRTLRTRHASYSVPK